MLEMIDMESTTDNNRGAFTVPEEHLGNLNKIANRKIQDLRSSENENLLIFPDCLNLTRDRIGKEKVFTIDEDKLTTENIMGFIGVNETEITIQSRFTQTGKDFFLHHMLHKVFSINMFDLSYGFGPDGVFDFIIYLFPYYLKKAVSQGIIREYQNRTYNDANVKGPIDVNRHIKQNYPFKGNIAYHIREYSYDNRITQLIRHTIEYLKGLPCGASILNNESETVVAVSDIVRATPTYNRQARNEVIQLNLKPVTHPYYYEFVGLQNICLRILRHNRLSYQKQKDKIYGILFDGAWLWEEYLNTILQNHGFTHPENKIRKNGIEPYGNIDKKMYPDFYKTGMVVDAKYKHISEIKCIDRNDLNQILAYMYILKYNSGTFISPAQIDNIADDEVGKLNGYGGEIGVFNFVVPQSVSSFNEFNSQLAQSTEKLITYLDGINNKKIRN